jgi:lysine biosynthesis protein LysW
VFRKPLRKRKIACDDCGSELEVTGKDSVQEAPQEEEDWGE